MLQGIHWLGHASVRIDDVITIYIDPWKVAEPKQATLGRWQSLSRPISYW